MVARAATGGHHGPMPRTLRLTSYNIRKAVGLDWRRDPQRVIDVIAETGADIVALQEADRRFGARAGVLPPEALDAAGYRVLPCPGQAPSHGWHGNVMLIRAGLGVQPQLTPLVLPGAEPRGALALHLPGLEVIGAHLALTPAIRLRQIAALRAHCDTVVTPLVIAGDFNDWGRAGAMRGAFGAGYRVVAPGPSFHSSRPLAALDRFVLHGALRNLGTRVHRSARAARASDHLPVCIDLCLERA